MAKFKLTSTRESSEEDATIAWAENNGWVVRLMSYRGRRGCPDSWFFGHGCILPIEFKKRVGGELSAGQIQEHKRLRAVGVVIPVFAKSEDAIAYLRGHMG